MEKTIANAVEDLYAQLEWSDEANALGEIEYDCDDNDQWGWLTMGSVRVEWARDEYGGGDTDWVAVQVTYDGNPMEDQDDYLELDDAVKAAAHRTDDWLEYRANELRDEIIAWLEQRGEYFDVLGPQDDEPGDAWTITWREVMIRGYFDGDGMFVWSVTNPESADYLDGCIDDDIDDVVEAIERCTADPMIEAWVETLDECTAEDDWSVRMSEDRTAVWMSEPTYTMARRATYEPMGFGEGRIELAYRLRTGEWRVVDECLPEDEDDARRMAREAYTWVKAVSD